MKRWKKIVLGIAGVACVGAIVPACVISCSSIYNNVDNISSQDINKTATYDAAMEIYQDVINAPIEQSNNGWTVNSALNYFKTQATNIIAKKGIETVLANVLPVSMIINGLDSGSLGFSNENFTNPYFDVTTNFLLSDLTVTVNSDNTVNIKASVQYTITDKDDSGELAFINDYEWDNVNINKTLMKIGNCYYGALLLTNSKNGLQLSSKSSFLNDVNVSSKFSNDDFNQLCNDCQWLPRGATIDTSDSIPNQLSQIKKQYEQGLSEQNSNLSYSSSNLLLTNWFLNQDQVFCYQNIYNFPPLFQKVFLKEYISHHLHKQHLMESLC